MQKNDAAAQRGGYYGYYPGPGPMLPPPRSNGRGLAIAAVSLAGIGLMGCWIPFLNVYSFVTFPIVLALAVGALVTAKRDPRVARVLAIVSIGIAILSAVLAWAVNSWAVDTWNNSPGSPKSLRESQAQAAGPGGIPGSGTCVLPQAASNLASSVQPVTRPDASPAWLG